MTGVKNIKVLSTLGRCNGTTKFSIHNDKIGQSQQLKIEFTISTKSRADRQSSEKKDETTIFQPKIYAKLFYKTLIPVHYYGVFSDEITLRCKVNAIF